VAIGCGYLARPGENVTGSSAYAGTEIWGKLLQLLREVQRLLRNGARAIAQWLGTVFLQIVPVRFP
jgi:hypothetical protein